MATEYVEKLASMEEMFRFLHQNYPVDAEDVQAVVKDAERHQNLHLKATSFLMNKAKFIAEKNGIVYNPDSPQIHLPTMLAALEEMETNIPQEQKQLSLSRKLDLLGSGESTTAQIFANRLKLHKESIKHSELSIKLFKFRNELTP